MRPDVAQKLKAAAPKQGPNPAIIGAVVAAVVIVGVMLAILIGNNNTSTATAATQTVPVGVVGGKGGGILVAPAAKDTVPTVDVYVDFQCPNCGEFEKAFGPALSTTAKAGQMKYIVHTLSFLDDTQHNQDVADVADASGRAGVTGTPTIKLNGKVIQANPRTTAPDVLVAAIKAVTK